MNDVACKDECSDAILEIGAALVSSLELEEALTTVVERIGAALDVTSVGLWRYSPPRSTATFEAFWSRDGDVPQDGDHVGRVVKLDTRPDYTVLATERRTVEHHLTDDDLAAEIRSEMETRGHHSTLAAPLVVGDEVLGCLSLAETRRERRFTEAEHTLLGRLCQLAAIGIHNAELYRREEEQRLRAESLLESSRAVAVSPGAGTTVDGIRAQIAGMSTDIELHVELFVDDGDKSYARFVADGDDGMTLARQSGPPHAIAQRVIETSRPVQGRTESDQAVLVVPLVLKDGVSGYLELVGRPARNFGNGEIAYVQTLANHAAVAVEKARLNRAAARQTGIDVPTGLYNRSYFSDRLFAEVARSYRYRETVTLIMMSIDDLDGYTDERGRPMDAEVMRAVGRFLKVNLRRRIDIACRWSDDVFAIMLPKTAPGNGGTAKAADRLRATMKSYSFQTQEDEPLGEISVCMGVACYPNHADDATDLPEVARDALLLARERGRGQVELAR